MKMALDLAAVEWLIGGDTELEVELRSSVVQEFARRHLKAVVADVGMQKHIDKISRMVQSSIDDEVKSRVVSMSWGNYKISDSMKLRIREEAGEAVSAETKQIVREIAAEQLESLRQIVSVLLQDMQSKLDKAIARAADLEDRMEKMLSELDPETKKELLIALLK